MSPEQNNKGVRGKEVAGRNADGKSDAVKSRAAGTAKKPGGSGRPAVSERQRRRKRTRIVVLAVAGAILLAGAAACVYYFGFIHPNDNYSAQMKIGMECYESGEYEDAEIAFLRALEYKSGDPEATLALADTYTAWKKFDKAVILLTALQDVDEKDTRTYERLITLYVSDMNDINAANAQIIKAYGLGLTLENEAIAAPPLFSPKGGAYNEVTAVTITAAEGQVVYYTTDGSIPTLESARYESELILKSKEPLYITAVVIAENGLIGWPATSEYAINVQYAIDSGFPSYIGKSAAEIMGSVGALFYVGEEEGGYYYRNKTGECFFVFPWDVFQVETPTATDGSIALPPDPNRTPLPGGAVCVAVSMEIGKLFVQMDETITVEDLMAGLSIETFRVEKSELDGLSHLYYSVNGYAFDYTLKDEATVAMSNRVIVRAG
jgi:tetratricopeptide (TPR) repeat protein